METRVRVGPGAETKHGITTVEAEGLYVDTLDSGHIVVLLDAPEAEDHPFVKWRKALDMGPGMHYAMGIQAIAEADTVVEIITPA